MRKYFKGYYFKCEEGNKAVALIPALHTDGRKSNASLQVITNDNVYRIPYPNIKFGRDEFKVRMGHNCFSEKGIAMDADSRECSIHGTLKFGRFQKLKYDIMGPFRYVPSMQCRHSIISMGHAVTGKIHINERVYDFENGTGYIEGDSGGSFPKEYIWTQCHHKYGSLFLAVADIPLFGLHFKGIIGVVMMKNREYRIATYLGGRVVSMGDDTVVVRQGRYTLTARLLQASQQGLYAPVNGRMARTIHESLSCRAAYQFICDNRIMLEFTSENASFEYEIVHSL